MPRVSKLLSLFLLFLSLSGCTLWDYLKPPEREVAPSRGKLEEGRELVHSFMQARLAGEAEDYMRAFLTEEAWHDYQGKEFVLKSTNNQELVGYKLTDESELSQGRFAFTVLVQVVEAEPVGARNTKEDIIVRYSEDEYRISSARLAEENLIQAAEDKVVWRGADKDGQEREAVLITLSDLPADLVPIGGREEERFGVGRDAFSSIVLYPDNKGLAFGTTGTHSLIATVTWDQLPPVREEQRELIPIDLVFEGTINLVVVSPDGKHVAIETGEASGSSRMRVYRTDERNRLTLGLDEAFPPAQYEVKFNRWEQDGGSLVTRVNAMAEATGVDQNKLGTWEINIKTGEREKIVS